MTTQTEAQRITASLESDQEHMSISRSEVAAELRRLDAENECLRAINTMLDTACAKLEAANAELLAACKLFVA